MPSEYPIHCNTDTHGELVPPSAGLQTATQEECYQQSYGWYSITNNGTRRRRTSSHDTPVFVLLPIGTAFEECTSLSTARHYVTFLPIKHPVYNTHSIQLKAGLAHRFYINSHFIYCVYLGTGRRTAEDGFFYKKCYLIWAGVRGLSTWEKRLNSIKFSRASREQLRDDEDRDGSRNVGTLVI